MGMRGFTDRIREKMHRRKSLRWSMVRRLLFGWLFPLFMLIYIIIFIVAANSHEQVEHTIMTSLEKSTEIMCMQIKDCETASKNASYMQVIAEGYRKYIDVAKEDKDKDAFRKSVILFLEQQY